MSFRRNYTIIGMYVRSTLALYMSWQAQVGKNESDLLDCALIIRVFERKSCFAESIYRTPGCFQCLRTISDNEEEKIT